jgi:hypothetical protein
MGILLYAKSKMSSVIEIETTWNSNAIQGIESLVGFLHFTTCI